MELDAVRWSLWDGSNWQRWLSPLLGPMICRVATMDDRPVHMKRVMPNLDARGPLPSRVSRCCAKSGSICEYCKLEELSSTENHIRACCPFSCSRILSHGLGGVLLLETSLSGKRSFNWTCRRRITSRVHTHQSLVCQIPTPRIVRHIRHNGRCSGGLRHFRV